MKQFCNEIKICLISDIEKVFINQIIPKTGKKLYHFVVDNFFIETNVSNLPASTLNEISNKFIAEKLPTEVSAIFATPRSVVVECSMDNCDKIIIGSPQYPAKLIITPNINYDIMKLDWKTPSQIKM